MNKRIIVGVLFFLTQAVNAQMIDIRGKITKEGSAGPVSAARISLKNHAPWITVVYNPIDSLKHDHYHSIGCLSDSLGNFHLTGNLDLTGATVNPSSSRGGEIIVRSAGRGGGLLVRTTRSNTAVGIDIYGINGRRVASERFAPSAAGDCRVSLSRCVSAMYLIKISMNNESRIFKTVPGMNLSFSMGSGEGQAGGFLRKQAAKAVSDSLVVTAQNFKVAFKPIQSYSATNISVSLSASNPWIPTGAREHQGGQVKITAKGHDFVMGQPCDTVRGIFFSMPTTDVEQPVHNVSFTHDFWMDTVEVRQGEFDSIMKIVYTTQYKGNGWNSSNGMGRDVAVYAVLWGDAALFCNARSKAFGLPDTAYSYSRIIGKIGLLCTLKNVKVNWKANAFRLPTEAEWEYAARGGTATDYYWGKNYDDYRTGSTADIGDYAVWYKNSAGLGKDDSAYGAHPVGKKKPDNYGLYDMLGNVSEWCNDWFDFYQWGDAVDPTGPDSGDINSSQIQRGGNWGNDPVYLRVTSREYATLDYPYFFMGFRTVKPILE